MQRRNRRRRSLLAPLRLAPIDLAVGVILTVLALTVVVGPVVAQTSSGATPSAALTAMVSPTGTPAPTPTPAAPGPTQSAAATVTSSIPAMTAAPGSSAAAAVTSSAGPTASSPVAAGPSPSPAASPAPCPLPAPTPTPVGPPPSPLPHNLCPAVPSGSDPFSFIAWIFTPIFQALFMGLALFYNIFGDIGTAIVALTLVIRLLMVPIFRAQIVSQRRMQMLQPELRAIQAKYKGNRAKISEEQMKLYKDRGVNPASGCLPALLQLVLLLPMYQVFSNGLSAPNISSMLQVFGQPVINVTCYDPSNPYAPCIDPSVWWLAWLPQIKDGSLQFYPGGMPANVPEIFLNLSLPIFTGLSLLALVSALLQLVQTRMMTTPSDDPQQRSQQRIFLILPLFSLVYGGFLPAGLFIYWITTTIFSIVQQYLINGWGGLFPLFGRTPAFARDHKPRYPVPAFKPREEPASAQGGPDGKPAASTRRSTTDSAAGTIRPARGRTSRRGRRR